MGLDQYLYAEVKAPKESPLFKVVEENLTDEHRTMMSETEEPYAYVSGWAYRDEPEELYKALVSETGMTPHEGSPHFDVYADPDGYRVASTIFYWRKANHIHNWFVEQVQNGVDECQRSFVHPEMLMDLLDRCEQVMKDHNLAPDLLPITTGFFFGGTEYDEWYFEDTESTAVYLKKQIMKVPHKSKFYYRASW
jgi:hypothetical protein